MSDHTPVSFSQWQWRFHAPVMRVTLIGCFGLMIVSELLVAWLSPAVNLDAVGLLAAAAGVLLLMLTVEVPRLHRWAHWVGLGLALVMLVRYVTPGPWPTDGALVALRVQLLSMAALLITPSAWTATGIALLAFATPHLAQAFSGVEYVIPQLLPVQYSLGAATIGYAWALHIIKRNTQRRIEEIRGLAEHDDLTGLYTRQAFMTQAAARVAACLAANRPAGLLYVDADHFKRINDTYGHDVGDRVLIALARSLEEAAGPDALVGRLGGEEFGVLWEGVDELACHRRALALQAAAHPEAPVPVSVSVGLAAAPVPRLEALLRRAELGLRTAKSAGRDQVATGMITPAPAAPGSG